MSFSKLKKLHVLIIGVVLSVLAGGLMYWFLIKPEFAKYDAAYARWTAAIPSGTEEIAKQDLTQAFASTRAAAEQDRANATNEKVRAQQELDAKLAEKMPKWDFSNRETGMIALWKDQILKMGPMLEGFANSDRSVEVLAANFTIPAPPVNPNDAYFDQELITFPLGSVTVQGDFKSIMKNIRRWNKCNRLILLSPPTLQGQSPALQAAYTVTCFIYPYAKGGPTVPMAGAATASAGAPTQ